MNLAEKAFPIHSDFYDYSESVYVNALTKVKIICPIHGPFWQRPNNHIDQKQGCPKCGVKKKGRKKTNEEFLAEAKAKWNYDYSKTNYTGKENKITFTCPIHGDIQQYPYLHLKSGCQFCNGRGISKHTKESITIAGKKRHGEGTYGYDRVPEDVKSIHDEIEIYCYNHGGYFKQRAANHISNLANGCPTCNGGVAISHDSYVERANNQHDGKFTYPDKYTKAHDKIKIVCPKHGEFEQLAYMHLQTQHACPECVAELTSSQAEKEVVDFLKKRYDGPIITNDRKILYPKEIDILLPELNLGIEFNGNYWHTESKVGRKHHLDKCVGAEKKDITLLQIFEYEWTAKREVVLSRLLSAAGKNKRIYARKTKIVSLIPEQKNHFLQTTHIQGKDNSSVYFGLEYEGQLVACMTFGKPRYDKKHDWELIRYSSELGTNVLGGAGKLLAHFQKLHKGSIISYADRRWSSGNLYQQLGFTFDGDSTPGYVYYHTDTKKVKIEPPAKRNT